jgi:hypothetical protein
MIGTVRGPQVAAAIQAIIGFRGGWSCRATNRFRPDRPL